MARRWDSTARNFLPPLATTTTVILPPPSRTDFSQSYLPTLKKNTPNRGRDCAQCCWWGSLWHVRPPRCQENGAKTGSHEQQKEALPPRKPQRVLSQQEMWLLSSMCTRIHTYILSSLSRPPGASLYIRVSCAGTPEVAAIMQHLWAKSERRVNHPHVSPPAWPPYCTESTSPILAGRLRQGERHLCRLCSRLKKKFKRPVRTI